MNTTVRKLIMVARPISWPNTAYPFAAAYIVTGGSPNIFFITATLFFIFPYNLMLYGINDIYDYDSDILNPRKGGVEGMKEERAFHPVIAKATGIICVPFVAYLLSYGPAVARWVLGLVLFFVVAYSVIGLRFKEKPIVDSITSSAHFVGPMLYGLALTGFPSTAWPYALAFFLWGMGSHAFGAVQDIIPDRTAQIASIATVLGARWTVRFSIMLYAVAAGLVALQGGWQ
jgi:4-hydroxybenzoate polyprenyltransferase